MYVHRINSLCSGILTRHTATSDSSNLIVEKMMLKMAVNIYICVNTDNTSTRYGNNNIIYR